MANQCIWLCKDSLEQKYNPVLHVTRHFGPFVRLTEEFYESSSFSKILATFRWTLKVMQNLIYALTQSETSSRFHDDKVGEKYDVVIISHADQVEYLAGMQDFYFGTLHNSINSEGLSVCYLLTNKNKMSFDDVLSSKSLVNCKPRRFILRNRLKWTTELYFVFLSVSATLGFLSKGLGKNYGCKKLMSLVASRSYEVIPNLRIWTQISEFVEKTSAGCIIFTYEGHGWERAVIEAARRINPGVVCIGYQHSSIFPLQYASRASVPREMVPDYIMCTGSLPMRYYQLSLFGSNKPKLINVGKLAGAASQSHHSSISGYADKEHRDYDLLVLLSGIADEYERVILFLKELSAGNNIYKVVIRPHPAVLNETLSFMNKHAIHKLYDISIDVHELNNVASRSRYALYCDSTAVMNAMRCGCKPIFASFGRSASLNPLHLFGYAGYTNVSSTTELTAIIKKGMQSDIHSQCRELDRLWGPQNSSEISRLFKNILYRQHH